MVTGNRNFMQPMGRLSMHSKCFDLFSVKFWGGQGGGGRRIVFSFFLGSQCVPNMLSLSSRYVPNEFPNMFSIVPHFFTHGLGGPKGRNSLLQNRTFYFGEPP